MTRAVIRPVGVYEVSFRQLFGGFLNMEGFCQGFYTDFGGFFFIRTRKNFWGERLRFPLHFSGEFLFQSLALSIRAL